MLETELIHYLSGQGFNCGFERNQKNIVIIQKTGGQLHDCQFSHTLAIQTYGPSKQKSAELAYKVLDAMLLWPDNSNRVANVELNAGPYDFTDTSTKEYRYQAVYDISEF